MTEVDNSARITESEVIEKKPIIKNRSERRERIRAPLGETLRRVKRVDRFMMLKDIAAQIKEWYPKDFKKNHKWKEIETEMAKLISVKGESNITKPKKKRK